MAGATCTSMAIRFVRSAFKILSSLLFLLVFVWCAGWWMYGDLPAPTSIRAELADDPEQVESDEEPFELNYREASYIVEPEAEYRVRGLVVTHNDINAFADIYHDKDSVDVKDICLIWGENVSDERYQQMTFWSEPWSCQVQWSRPPVSPLRFDQVGNNHILAADAGVLRAIRNIRIGDQIELTGKLVNYYPKNYPTRRRSTSLVRDDMGNGACEVMLVTGVKIFDQFRPKLYTAYERAGGLLPWSIGLWFVVGLLLPYIEYRQG